MHQCDLKENLAEWDEDRIWAEFCSSVNGNGFEPKEGPVIEMWFDCSATSATPPCGTGNLARAGDAAHTVPPTGAKGLNRAMHAVKVLLEELDKHYNPGLDRLKFSCWMTIMQHTWQG